MKIRISILILILCIITGFSSCVDFLDQTPDAVALSEEQIFTDYDKSQQFIDQLLVRYTYFDDIEITGENGQQTFTGSGFFGKTSYGLRERMTDNCIANQQYAWHIINKFRNSDFQTITNQYWAEGGIPRFITNWKGIRVCNLAIANVSRIKNATDEQKSSILGMAYFCRAHFYFMLLQGWGGMPWITKPMDPEQNMDLPRDSYVVTAQKIAATFDTAAIYLPLVVNDVDWGRPSKMAALACKAKALIWAASPYANPDNNQKLWQDAAVACAQAIDVAEKSGYYRLVDMNNFKQLFFDVNDEALHENLWGRFYNNFRFASSSYWSGIKSKEFGSGSYGAESVTENLAQCYSWSNGEPVDPATTEYATNPFYGDGVTHTGRDPRFYQTILFNGATTPQVAAAGRKVEIWNKAFNNVGAKELVVGSNYVAVNGYTMTGYYNWKFYSNAFVTHGYVNIMWNFLRLADLYLYYAEAANRAWGPTAPPQGVPGFTMTAVESLNKIRIRAKMPVYDNSKPWLTIGSANQFEKIIRNETRIENAFESKRFYDLRRWKTMLDPENQIMKGLYIERTANNAFRYSVVLLSDNLNMHLMDRNYLFKINPTNTYLGPNFKQNPGW